MAEYDRSATGPLPVDAGPRRAENIFDLSPEDFRASLGEMQAMGHDTDALMRQYRARNSPFAPINNAAAAQAQDLADSGRRPVLGGLLSKPEGATGMDAITGLEREGWRGLLGAGQQVGQAFDAPAAAAQGLIPQADVNMEALNTAGMAMGAGGAATAPSGALRSGLARGAGFDDIKAAFPDVRIDIGGSPDSGFTLGKIIVPEGGRGAGVGTQVMEAITRRADELGGQINLTPSADFGGNVGRLRDFYARQGFVRNTGRNRDFSTQEDMYRTAQANASESGGLLGAGLSEAQRQARDILDMRAAGNARSVTDDMMARADDQYMFDNTPLPMDEASRLARAQAGGLLGSGYHGSTHVFDRFGGGTTRNIEGHFGAGDYITSSADDASRNYAGEGPDLTQRLQIRAEQLADELDVDYDSPEAMSAARAELSGGTDGVIYPIQYRTQKPFDISDDGNTFLDYDQPRMDPEDYLDEAGGDMDLAEELAMDDSYNQEPQGDLVDFVDAVRYDGRVSDSEGLLGAIEEGGMDGGLLGRDLDEIMRGNEWFSDDDFGAHANNEVYRNALQSAGFDSITHSGNIFKGMEVEPGTTHTILNSPSNIRSRFARFDPEFSHLSNLSAANASPTAGLLASGAQEQDKPLPFMEMLRGLLR
jgi:GNAT superfamily N-acetyltransferase